MLRIACYESPATNRLLQIAINNKATLNPLDKTQDPIHEISSKKHKERVLAELIHEDLPPDELRRSLIASITEFERSFRNWF